MSSAIRFDQIPLSISRFKILLLFIFSQSVLMYGQNNENLETKILSLDSIFWNSYNKCDIQGMGELVSDDVEFYHDKGGLTQTKESLIESIKNNLCSTENYSLRRAELAGSVQVFPMDNYGALITGQHVFYVSQNGNQEFLDGLARFTQLWNYKDKKWKMTRILSYDHGPAPQNIDKKQIKLTTDELHQFIGRYQAPKSGKVEISIKDGHLFLDAGKMTAIILPTESNIFFHQEAPLTFEFVENSEGLVEKMMVKEHGKIVEEAIKE